MQNGVRAATQQRWEDAERFFQIVLQQEPDSASAYSNLGNVHLSEGRAEEAVRDFSRAIAIAPTAPVPYLNRAIAEEQLGVNAASSGNQAEAERHYEAALRDCRDAQDRDSKEFAAFFNEGNVQVRVGQYEAALAAYSRAADLAPGIAGYRLRQAELLFQNARPADADSMMRGVVRKNPNYAEAQAALAAVEWVSGQQGKAEEHFDKAVSLDGRWRKMGFIRQQTRWPPALYDAMEKFLAIAGSS
ncbi:TPR-like protein [Coccomyxa subellipsoidea C-169]|uniref:TPR-like protein n=1 Tax=Coccomyxa subellipsoidea (strain C-169) TaxID=574566 RepID=I0YSK6_COCSC|nr:TPR-like protein [Coccomyxa subellipsoidea C-169]EIE21375.1 TPR-like protein [Coccomyxa subellipsoidea C-169]|eukprot:XP_005645919.1 TPR-like protein [Coccomyxa subellipsoidea C-169]